MIPRFVEALLGEGAPVIHGDGRQSRDFVHVADVVAANLAAAAAPASACGAAYNVATGRATTLRELLALLAELTGRDAAPRHEPPRAGDLRHSQADVTRAAEALAFRARVELAEGLRASLPWYRELVEGRG